MQTVPQGWGGYCRQPENSIIRHLTRSMRPACPAPHRKNPYHRAMETKLPGRLWREGTVGKRAGQDDGEEVNGHKRPHGRPEPVGSAGPIENDPVDRILRD